MLSSHATPLFVYYVQAKTTKKITLRLECKDCKYKMQLPMKRCKHFEVRCLFLAVTCSSSAMLTPESACFPSLILFQRCADWRPQEAMMTRSYYL